jgi:hypothetical protein
MDWELSLANKWVRTHIPGEDGMCTARGEFTHSRCGQPWPCIWYERGWQTQLSQRESRSITTGYQHEVNARTSSIMAKYGYIGIKAWLSYFQARLNGWLITRVGHRDGSRSSNS